jgi:hypothetical protein
VLRSHLLPVWQRFWGAEEIPIDPVTLNLLVCLQYFGQINYVSIWGLINACLLI